MTYRTLLRGTLALVAVGALAACGSDSESSSTTAAAATTTPATATTAAAPTTAKAATTAAPTTAKAATTAAPTTAKAATTTTAASGSPGYEIPNSLPATTTAAATPAGASLSLFDDAKLGKILVDSEGYTMYLFTKDTSTTSVCLDKCAAAWPPAVVTGTPTAGAGVDASKLTASAQPDGTMQLTYNGHLLYRFAGDSGPGMTNGQDVNEVWYVLDAAGNQVG